MTIKPQQADFMNYTYFFKSNYRKGLHRMMMMLTDPSQFQALIENPVALAAAFGPDKVQTPALCKAVLDMGEEKRTAVANAYSSIFGYSTYQNLLDSDDSPYWQKSAVVSMTTDLTELNLENFKLAVTYGIAVDDWIGQDISLGKLKDENSAQWDGDFTIIATNHDDKSDGSGKATFTLAYIDGEMLNNGSTTKTSKMNSTSTANGGWGSSLMRTNLNNYSFVDSEINSLLVPVNKVSHNDNGKDNINTVSVTSDKFWLLSAFEIFGNNLEGSDEYPYYVMEGTPYEYLVNSDKKRVATNYSTSVYWTRSTAGTSETFFRYVQADGTLAQYSASTTYCVVPCCCF